VDNNDVRITPAALRAMQEAVRRALERQEIAAAFECFEAEANRAKKLHNSLGLTALVLLIATLLLATFRLMAPRLGLTLPQELETFGLIAGPIPLLIFLWLRLGRVHERWLLSRYKAERIRHWKFHQLLRGSYIEGRQSSAPGNVIVQTDTFEQRWADLMEDISQGTGSMENFLRNEDFCLAFPVQVYNDQTVAGSALDAYRRYRLNVQINWFTQEEVKYTAADRKTGGAAYSLLLGGAILTFLDPILHLLLHGSGRSVTNVWLLGIGVALTLLSAGVRVYRSASGISENAERYQNVRVQLVQLRRDLERLEQQNGTQEDRLKVLTEVERVLHTELVEFLRVAKKSDYLL